MVPSHRVNLGRLPTPIHKWRPAPLVEDVDLWIKRDDISGMQMSGNKVRKLEFLLAEALAQGHDCVITIGGIQSNHCRATAVAARYLGLECHLVLRTSKEAAERDPGLVGNLLVDRLVGAHLHLVTKEEYGRIGGDGLGAILAEQLRSQGKNPYVIPVGGSNALGSWGYLEFCEELSQQSAELGVKFTDVVVACGSGGTACGLALGLALAPALAGARLHAYGVCDDPDYFYDYIDGLLGGLGAEPALAAWAKAGPGTGPGTGPGARALLTVLQARGAGYAMSREEELQTVQRAAAATGVVLDPVYSGKALHAWLADVAADPLSWQGRRVLFVHTGGLLGMYDKVDQLQPHVAGSGDTQRMQL